MKFNELFSGEGHNFSYDALRSLGWGTAQRRGQRTVHRAVQALLRLIAHDL